MKQYSGESASPSTGNDISLGRFSFRVVRRILENDSGITIHLFGPYKGVMEEVMRFDCFETNPHYHLGWSYRNDKFIEIHASDPFKWAIEQIQSNINDYLHAAGSSTMNNIELSGLPKVTDAIQQLGAKIRAEAK